MQAGRLDLRATFRKRGPGEVGSLPGRGSYIDDFTVAAEWRQLSGKAVAEAGALTDAIEGTLVVRDTPRTRALTVAHRVVVLGREMAIDTVPPSDRSGWLFLRCRQTRGSA